MAKTKTDDKDTEKQNGLVELEDDKRIQFKKTEAGGGILLTGAKGALSLAVGPHGPAITFYKSVEGSAELKVALELHVDPETGRAMILVPNGRGGGGRLALDEILDKHTPNWR